GTKGSWDALSVTLLPRNLGVQLYFRHGWDIKALKEPAPQFLVQQQPKDSGPGTETHVVVNPLTVDLVNVSRGPLEVAASGSAGYDLTGGNLAFTGSIGGKLTLAEDVKLPILSIFGPGTVRLYGGVSAEGD